MNKAKCSKELYCDFLTAAQTNFTCTQLADLSSGQLAHDAVNRWLGNHKMTPSILREHTKPLVALNTGYLCNNDTFRDNMNVRKGMYHANQNSQERCHYSGRLSSDQGQSLIRLRPGKKL